MRFKKLLAAAVTAAMAAMMIVVPASAQTLPVDSPVGGFSSGVYELEGDTQISYNMILAEGADVTINLNGHTLTSTSSNGYNFNANKTNSSLTIIGKGTVKNTGTANGISASGNITIKNANVGKITLIRSATCVATFENVTFDDTVGLNAKGSFNLVNCKAGEGIVINTANNTTTITGADTKIARLSANADANITISDGNIETLYLNDTDNTITITGNPQIGEIVIDNSLFQDNKEGVLKDTVTLTITGGTFKSQTVKNEDYDYEYALENFLDKKKYTLENGVVVPVDEATDTVTYEFIDTHNGVKLPVQSELGNGSYQKNREVKLSTSREAFAKEAPEYVFYGWNVNEDTTTHTGYEATVVLTENTTVSPNAPWAFANAKEVTPDENNVYTITSAEELEWVSQQVYEGLNSFEDCTIRLDADINLEGKAWYPIGDETNPFRGTFDGNNKTISNMKCNSVKAGVIGNINGGTVKDLKVTGADVYAVTTDVYSAAGGIVGDATDSAVLNCTATSSTVQTYGTQSFNGGIVGHGVNTNVTGCTVDGLNLEGIWKTGGIAGYLDGGKIEGANVSKVDFAESNISVGSIAGHAQNDVTITNAVVDDTSTYNNDSPVLVGTIYSSTDHTFTINGSDTDVYASKIIGGMEGDSNSNLIIDGGEYHITLEGLEGIDVAYKEVEGSPNTYNLVTVGSTQTELGGYRTVSEGGTYKQMYVFEQPFTATDNSVKFSISSNTNDHVEQTVTFDAAIDGVSKIGLIITDIPDSDTVTVELAQ